MSGTTADRSRRARTAADRLPASLLLTPVSRRPTRLSPETEAHVLTNNLHLRFSGRGAPNVSAPRVSIVVATSDNLVFLKFCIASILANTRSPSFELIVVDNGSTDGTAQYLDELVRRHPSVRRIRNADNRGFAPAVNQGLRLATGQVLVLLNDDTVVSPRWLAQICGHLQDPAIGLLGPVTNRAGNECQIPTSYRTYGEFLHFASARGATARGVLRDIPMLTMFCLAMRRDVWMRVGSLDERFAVGMFEDDDYAMRARRCGLRIACAEDVFIHHFGATSLGKLARDGRLTGVFDANRRRFEEKWQTRWTSRRCRVTPEYEQLVDRIRAGIGGAVPPASRIAVVSRGDEALLDLPGCTGMHFPQMPDGAYTGHHPADSDEAIERLKATRDLGAEYLLIPRTMRWWLEFYREFETYLGAHHRLVSDGEWFALYALDPAEPRG